MLRRWSGFWRDVSAHLAARGWRVIAVDLPPFGYSDRDPKARYDRASQAQRLAELLKATAKRPAAVADTVTPIAEGENLARVLHPRSFARMPGVGHIPHIEAPQEFLAARDAALR